MTKRNEYINCKRYFLRLWPDSGTFDFGIDGYGWVLKNAVPAVKTDRYPKNTAFKSVRKYDSGDSIPSKDAELHAFFPKTSMRILNVFRIGFGE